MQLSNIPEKIAAIFAASGTKNIVPLTTAGAANPNNASYDVGFPPITMEPIVSGGLNPFGADFNGMFNALTAIQQWQSAGGLFPYDSAFSSSIGGYPKGSMVLMAGGAGIWQSTSDNNTSDPDTGGANWTSLVTLSQFSNATATNGYQEFPGGVILQWGYATTTTGGVATATLSAPFISGGFASIGNYTAGAGQPYMVTSGAITKTTATFYLVNASGTGIVGQSLFYFVVGI